MAHNTEFAVADLVTESGRKLVMRSYPSITEVRSFVKEHNRRYSAGEYGSPDGIDAHGADLETENIIEAYHYPEESDIGNPEKAVKINLIPTSKPKPSKSRKKTTKPSPLTDEN